MMELKVDAMSCSHCVASVTRAVQAIDAAAKVDVDLAAKTVRVDTARPEADVARAIEDAGYPVRG